MYKIKVLFNFYIFSRLVTFQRVLLSSLSFSQGTKIIFSLVSAHVRTPMCQNKIYISSKYIGHKKEQHVIPLKKRNSYY
jgi:hypothetical protein